MSNPITIQGVRFSYCNLFQPKKQNENDTPKYSTTILLPKTNVQAKALIDQAIAQATNDGVGTKWGGVKPPMVPHPVHDGDGTRPSDGRPFGEECKGCWVFTANSAQQPFVVDAQVQPIINPMDVYSGMYGNVSVTFYPYNANNGMKKGIGCGLNGVQKVNDGEPLGGSRVTAETAFQPVPQTAAAGYGQPPTAPAPAYNAAPAPSQPAYTPAPAAAPGYTPPPVNAAPAASSAAPGYGAAYGTAYPASVQQYVNPSTGEVVGGYVPQGMSIAGI